MEFYAVPYNWITALCPTQTFGPQACRSAGQSVGPSVDQSVSHSLTDLLTHSPARVHARSLDHSVNSKLL